MAKIEGTETVRNVTVAITTFALAAKSNWQLIVKMGPACRSLDQAKKGFFQVITKCLMWLFLSCIWIHNRIFDDTYMKQIDLKKIF